MIVCDDDGLLWTWIGRGMIVNVGGPLIKVLVDEFNPKLE
jgi:hypothetical protein